MPPRISRLRNGPFKVGGGIIRNFSPFACALKGVEPQCCRQCPNVVGVPWGRLIGRLSRQQLTSPVSVTTFRQNDCHRYSRRTACAMFSVRSAHSFRILSRVEKRSRNGNPDSSRRPPMSATTLPSRRAYHQTSFG